jgi:hypothetical protein
MCVEKDCINEVIDTLIYKPNNFDFSSVVNARMNP